MKVIKQNKFEISSSITIFRLDNLEASKIRLDAFYHFNTKPQTPRNDMQFSTYYVAACRKSNLKSKHLS